MAELLEAAAAGDIRLLQNCLENELSLEIFDQKGRSALHIAAAKGHVHCCQLLLDYGIYAYAKDYQGNTAAHVAVMNNQLETLKCLYDFGKRNALWITSNEIYIHQEDTFIDICQLLIDAMPIKKLADTETPRFEKVWLYDTYVEFRTYLDPKFLKQTADPNSNIIDYVLNTFDPRPETGIYISSQVYNALRVEDNLKFIPTIASVHDLSFLLQQCIRLCLLDVCNGLFQRTPLHVACDANTTDSHRDVIYYLLNECGCNCNLLDKNRKSPLELLIQEKHNLLDAPTASRLGEELLVSHREEYFSQRQREATATVASQLEWKRDKILQECQVNAYTETPLLWDAYRNAGKVIQTYPTWTKFEDIETQNVFYGHTVDSLLEGKHFDCFQWHKPENSMEIDRKDALIFWCSAKSVILRHLGEWDMLQCQVTSIIFYIHISKLEIWFTAPEEVDWSLLLRDATPFDRIGFFQEWTRMQDKYGNKFYYNVLMNKMSWDRPADAEETTVKDQLCYTTYVDRNIEQKIFSCDYCRVKTKLDGKGLNLRFCEPCAIRCHWNHKGVRLVRTGFAKCGCKSCFELIGGEGRCSARVPSKRQRERQRQAAVLDKESIRRTMVDIFSPPVFALVQRTLEDGMLQRESGWMLCRRAPTAETVSAASFYCAENGVEMPEELLTLYGELEDIHTVNEDWVLVQNPVHPVVLSTGNIVLCTVDESPERVYGIISEVGKWSTYTVLLKDEHTRVLHRSRLELQTKQVFYFNEKSGHSCWNMEDFMGNGSGALVCTGSRWKSISERAILRRQFEEFDECIDSYSGQHFYIQIRIQEHEDAALIIQKLIRKKFAFECPLEWVSNAYTFVKPSTVVDEEKRRGAWAYLRRRSRWVGQFADVEQREWEEYVDARSAEYFYWNEDKNEFRWTKPPLPRVRDEQDYLKLGDAVLYRFTREGPEEECTVVRLREDDATGEDMYDVQCKLNKERIGTWIPRLALKRVPMSLDDAALRKLEALWISQIRRQRAAETRKTKITKLIRAYVTIDPPGEELSPEEFARREGARRILMLQEELDYSDREEKRKAAARQTAVEQSLVSRNIDPSSTSRSEVIRLQRATELALKIQEKIEYRKYESSVVAESKEQVWKQYEEEEVHLRDRESGLSTPRTLRRRKLVREVHRAMRRQQEGGFICDCGCKEWIHFGSEREEHLNKICRLRQVYCSLECGLHMTEDQWLTNDFQFIHETEECPNRLIYCPLQCLEWIFAKDEEHHTTCLCPKRPGKVLYCRLACGKEFGGSIDQQLDAEDERYAHEAEECELRRVKCSWNYGDGKTCGAMIFAKDRDKHRDEHIQLTGITTFRTPGSFTYRVPDKIHFLKVQAWGAGGGSGCFKDRRTGSGGGGAMVEVILTVRPRDILDVSVGEGGRAGIFGTDSEHETAGDPSTGEEEMSEFGCGVANGGYPGGGVGYGGNPCFACGGGGGYTSVSRRTPRGPELLIIAGGGGGGGSLDGVPATGIYGILPGTKINRINGEQGSEEKGGKAGEAGGVLNSKWAPTAGEYYNGGNGSEFGAGGGGGFFGGGGGGTLPGIAGGGGGGSSWVQTQTMKDIVSIGGNDHLPGGSRSHGVPEAVGAGEWDKVGGLAGEGGHTVNNCNPSNGNNGGIRILKPGFY